jgi:uncharacterized protein YbaR (Trm112 family)
MKREMLDVLACPLCRSHPLELTVEKENDLGVVKGALSCPVCHTNYPIEDSIPDMVSPEQR